MRALFYVIAVVTLFSCDATYVPKMQYLSVIIDLSEIDSYRPQAKDILQFLGTGNHADGIDLNLKYIAETRFSEQFNFKLGIGDTGLLSNEDQRRRKRKSLLNTFADTLNAKNSTSESLKRSEIFLSLVSELNRLSETNDSPQILLFADLKQHSDWFSVYRASGVELLLNDFEKAIELFETKMSIPKDLSGITLNIVYKPTLQEDEIFSAFVALYRRILEPRGLKITVGNTYTIVKT